MIDRGIGIAGIALSIIFGALQFFEIQIPDWVIFSGIGVGVFMLGLSIGLMRTESRKAKTVKTALLRLHTYRDHRVPDSLEMKNIFRWYYLSHIIKSITIEGKKEEIEFPTLFVTFEPEVQIATLKVRSPDMKLPRHEVKEFTQKYAIVVFSEKLKEGTLEILVVP